MMMYLCSVRPAVAHHSKRTCALGSINCLAGGVPARSVQCTDASRRASGISPGYGDAALAHDGADLGVFDRELCGNVLKAILRSDAKPLTEPSPGLVETSTGCQLSATPAIRNAVWCS